MCPAECKISGGHGGGETPVPIPNTAVKPARADGTWGEAPWESRSPPGFLNEIPSELRLEGISLLHKVAFPRRRRCRLCFVVTGAGQEELNRALLVGHFHIRVGGLMVFVVRWAGSTSSGRSHHDVEELLNRLLTFVQIVGVLILGGPPGRSRDDQLKLADLT